MNPVLVSIFNNDLKWNKIIFKVFSPVLCWKGLVASQISSQNLWESQKQLEENLDWKGPQETFSLTFCTKDKTRFLKNVSKTWLAKNKYGDSRNCSYNLPKAICSTVLTVKSFPLYSGSTVLISTQIHSLSSSHLCEESDSCLLDDLLIGVEGDLSGFHSNSPI